MATRQRNDQQLNGRRVVEEEEEEEDDEDGSSPEVNQLQKQPQERVSENAAQRREIRKQYHQLLTQTQEHKAQLTEPGKEDLNKNIQEGNKLFQHVTHAREGALDAQWFSCATRFSIEQAQKIPVGKQFDPVEFVGKLKAKFVKQNTGAFDWTTLGKTISPLFYRYVPSTTFMNGPMHAEPKPVKERKQSKRKQLENEKAQAPEEITQQQREDNETTLRVAKVVEKMKRVEAVKQAKSEEALFEEVLVDPNSFTKTIENIFYFSFLVKDGKAAMKKKNNENNESQIVVAITQPVAEQFTNKKQCVMKLDLAHFQQLANRAQQRQMNLNLDSSNDTNAANKRARQQTQEEVRQQQQQQPAAKRRR